MADAPRKAQAKIGARRRARECAAQVLYQLDSQPGFGGEGTADRALELYWAARLGAEEFEEQLPPAEVVAFAESLVRGVASNLEAIDRTLQKSTQHWRLERMARVDRNILRLAVYELLHDADVPARVVLNEAIDIAKKFGTEESGAFVNGILDRVAQDVKK
jgi:N utilization substance protein B